MKKKEIEPQEDTLEQGMLKLAIQASLEASRLVSRYWPHPLNPDFNPQKILTIFDKQQGVGNYATIADKESEQYIIERIRREPLFASHSVVGEESDPNLEKSPWRWFIDPIDGTLNFRNGLPDFSILIGIVKGNDPRVGTITMPASHTYISARKGHGAVLSSFDGTMTKNLTTLPHLPKQPMDKMLVGFDVAYEHRDQLYQQFVEKIADRVGYAVSYAGLGAGIYRLALGSLGGYFAPYAWRWDIAAASVIIPEVGGVVSDMQGNSINWDTPTSSFLAARTPLIHQKLLEMLNE